jgi:2-dehydropantoate 2-reductase
MKILIYGGGSVGLGIASSLLKAGEDIDIIARSETVALLRDEGLLRTGIFGEFHVLPHLFKCYASLKELPSNNYDHILVCTKSYDSFDAAKDISKHPALFDKQTKIILFQNGWGNAETFISFFQKEKIYNARVITGFQRPNKNHVEITVHADAIHIGSLYVNDLSALEGLAASISKGGIPSEISNHIGKDLWGKMLYNCALNPLGAIFNVPYGVLGELEYGRRIMKSIVEEVFLVMEGAGYSTNWESADAYLAVFYEKLLPPTAEHESSMLQDIRANKRTEIEALNGAVVHLGEKLGIPVTCNSMACNMIKFMECRNIKA